MSEQKEAEINKTAFNPNFKAYLNNLPIPSFTTPFWRNTAKKISTSMPDQSTDTNHTRMEHISLSAFNIGSKELAIGSVRLVNQIIAEANQANDSIDIRQHGDCDFAFGSWKTVTKSVDFGRNAEEKIGMNPSRTIEIPHP